MTSRKMPESHFEQTREWMAAHNLIPAEQCGYRISQTIEQCHAYQRKRGRCPNECEYQLKSVGRRKPGHSKFNIQGVQLDDDGIETADIPGE